ncbi:PIN domain-containing protein [Lamprobacter modestohalophilus]|uniref:type II toxin-antitoxin system VapC family toxin n=1 Tax=Lamprobacter modestohalophilus TaxID=1064514 RepID=UPI002ADEC503|nr:PIN domain-containing protein [Lamprobacter modestohalophilus]MEA1052697.1 PIN domain-containing protein [Lamprobacter modestohalophilus]
MSEIRTAIDANLLIAAWSAKGSQYAQALRVLEAPNRRLIVSDALWLEVMPKAAFHRQHAECRFYEAVFQQAENRPWSPAIVERAKALASTYGLAAMDAIHLAVAVDAQADEFISGEKPSKPMFRVEEVRTRSLWSLPEL